MAIWYKILVLFNSSSLASNFTFYLFIWVLSLLRYPKIRAPKSKTFITVRHVIMGTVFPNTIWSFRNSGFVTTYPLYWQGLEICHETWKGTIRSILLYSLLALFTLSQLQKHESLFHCLKHKFKYMF